MKTYLLTWNPEKWPWEDLDDVLNRFNSGQNIKMSWTCANKKPQKGDRVFLLKQGNGIRGIMGSGKVSKTSEPGPHYNEKLARLGKMRPYIQFIFDRLLDPDEGTVLFTSEIQNRLLNGPANFAPQCSGVVVEDSVASKLEKMWRQHLIDIKHDPDLWAFEGEQKHYFTLHRNRENKLREAKIAQMMAANNGRLKCEVPLCSFDFAKVYGEIGVRYAQVHHVLPLAKGGIQKTRLDDLKVVCANCHVMIHRGGQCRKIETLIQGKPHIK